MASENVSQDIKSSHEHRNKLKKYRSQAAYLKLRYEKGTGVSV